MARDTKTKVRRHRRRLRDTRELLAGDEAALKCVQIALQIDRRHATAAGRSLARPLSLVIVGE
jgi:hypothetical protein